MKIAAMRARVARLLPGTAGEKRGRISRNTANSSNQKTAEGVMHRLNRERRDLSQAVAEGKISKYA
jgi:hypothetical protein